MGCGSSMHKGDTVGAPQAIAEAEELQRLREENAELKRQNVNLIAQVQELSQRLSTVTMDVTGLRNEMSQAAATAARALQVAQTATDRAEAASAAAAAASQTRPPTAGPIPMPAADSQLSTRVQQLESLVATLQDKLESQRAKEEFAKQLRAAQAAQERVSMPLGPQPPQQSAGGSNNSSMSASGGPGGGGAGPSSGRPSSGADAIMIDGNGLLPANNNFPSRFGGGPTGLRAARERTSGRMGHQQQQQQQQQAQGGGADDSFGGPGGSGGIMGGGMGPLMQTAMPGAVGAGDELMSTHRYGNVLPSDLKLAEQRRQGPKQFL